MDTFGKIFTVIVLVCLIIINPLQYIYESKNSIVSSNVDSIEKEFVDEVCNSGKITTESYGTLLTDLSKTGELYDIEMEHTHMATGIDMTQEDLECSTCAYENHNEARIQLLGNTTHVHTDSCYAGTKHTHSSGCYSSYPTTCSICDGSGSISCQGTVTETSTASSSQCGCGNVVIKYTVYVRYCSSCGAYGLGWSGTGARHCPLCDGWVFPPSRQTLSHTSTTCYNCSGSGQISVPYLACSKSNGSYYDNNQNKVEPCCDSIIVNIKAVSTTQTINIGESLNTNVIVTYLDGDTETVSANTTFNTNTVGTNQTATLTYSGYSNAASVANNSLSQFTCNVTVTVINPKVLTSIVAKLSKTTIERNEAFPITSVTLKYSNNTTETVTSGWTITGFDKTKGGSQTVTISYTKDGVTKTTTKTIYVRMLASITANLSKTTIERNEAFPITSVTLKYNNNTTETVTSGWTITGFDKTKGGSQTVTISYTKNGVTKTTTKTIYVRILASITANLSKTTVQKYSELPLTSLTLTYNNGTTETVTSGWSYTGYNPNVRGKYQVTITYPVNGVTCSTKVTITVTNLLCTCPYCGETYDCDDSDVDNGCQDCKNKVDSLYVNPSYLILQKGEPLNITVEVIYRDGHREKVTGWTSNYAPNCLGGQVVTIQYQGLRAQITVKVVARVLCPHCNNYYEYDNEAESACPICSKQIVSITASPNNIKVNYGEELNLTVTATYRDGHTEIVYGYETTYNRFSIGIQNVTVSYNNAFTEITVEVVKAMTTCPICNREYDGSTETSGCPFCSTEIVSIRASLINDGTKVQLGSDLILRVIVAYRDNHREAKYSGYTVEDYDKNKLGEQTVRVLYKGYSCNLLIEVVNELMKVTCPNGHVYSLNEDRSDPGCPYCVTETEDNEMSYLVVTYTDEILEKLEEDGVYQIPSGDYFTIKIKCRDTSRNKNPLQSLTKIDVLYVKKEYVNGGEVK